MNVKEFKKQLEQFKNETLDTIIIHPNIMKTMRDECYGMSKWKLFLEGFYNIYYILDSYETAEHFPDDFWESLNWGYFEMYIFPYDDWFNPTISKERQLRLGQKPKVSCVRMYKGLAGEYIAFVEGGYTICAQPDREKANSCLEYYKSQNPTAEFYGTWED